MLQSRLMQLNARYLLPAETNVKNPSVTSCLGRDNSPDTGVCLAIIPLVTRWWFGALLLKIHYRLPCTAVHVPHSIQE